MNVLRTPDERFDELPDYSFAPHYADLDDGIRVHYVDEGRAAGPTVLLMHGEPSWSYLYRKMIPVLVAAGCRCIAPDLVGFGRSDKPADIADYSYQAHVDWMTEALFTRLGLREVTFFGQDWGGLIGLRLVAAEPDRFARVVVANTGLPTGDAKPTEAFLAWQTFAREAETFPIGGIISGGCANRLAPEIVAAYDAPFPDDSYCAAPRAMPGLIPTSPDDPAAPANRSAWAALCASSTPMLVAFSDSDPITGGMAPIFQRKMAGAQGIDHPVVGNAGHFLQEDAGEELAGYIVAFLGG
jgi:haloalkane dehalogenase